MQCNWHFREPGAKSTQSVLPPLNASNHFPPPRPLMTHIAWQFAAIFILMKNCCCFDGKCNFELAGQLFFSLLLLLLWLFLFFVSAFHLQSVLISVFNWFVNSNGISAAAIAANCSLFICLSKQFKKVYALGLKNS